MRLADTSTRIDAWLVAAGVALGLLIVGATLWLRAPDRAGQSMEGAPAGWSEQRWPFPVDPWWPSKAFSCPAAVCGSDLTVYLRAKIGFCNCKTGVADDEELERIGDFALIADGHAPTAAGRPIAIGTMKGRSRPYAFDAKGRGAGAAARSRALLIGYNDRCDAVVATALVDRGEATAVERTVLDLLASPRVTRWVEITLGL